MTILIVAAVLLTIALVASAVRRVSLRRHRAAAQAAIKPVVIDSEVVDIAELVWSVRQATHTPRMQTIGSPLLKSTDQVLDVVNASVDSLSPDQRLGLITDRTRLQQTRQAREDLVHAAQSLATTAGPAAVDALVIAITEAIDPSLLAEGAAHVTSMVANVVLDHGKAGGLLDLVPGSEHMVDFASTAAGDFAGSAMGAVVDAHVPVMTIVTAIRRANRSRENGLEAARVGENLAWDIGAKGGSIALGAAIGTAILPGIGTLIGGVVGAGVGSGTAHFGKNRHVAEARRNLLGSVERLAASVNNKTLLQIVAESERMLSMKRQRYRDVTKEVGEMAASQSWRQRVFRPPVGCKIAERVVRLAATDIRYEESMHNALRATIAQTAGSPIAKVYLWTAGQRLMGWRTFAGPNTSGFETAVNLVKDERSKLDLAR